MKKGCLVLLFLLIAIFLVNAAEAKSLKKGEVYRSLDGVVIEVISKSELEKSWGGKTTIVAEYDFKGDKLRVVANVGGTKSVFYYRLTEKGLVSEDEDGKVYYSKAGLALREEKKRKYSDNGNGIVSQGIGLMWQKEDDNTKGDWDSAISYCEGLSLGGGYNDWRLPNIDELTSIIDEKTNRQ